MLHKPVGSKSNSQSVYWLFSPSKSKSVNTAAHQPVTKPAVDYKSGKDWQPKETGLHPSLSLIISFNDKEHRTQDLRGGNGLFF